jgi:hypothetical protein
MWAKLTGFIVRNRVVFLLLVLAVTVFMGYRAKDVQLSYDFPQVIPVTDSDYVYYQRFKKLFGEDGDLLIIGFQNKEVFRKDLFNSWYDLADKIKKVKGVQTVATVANLLVLSKDTASHKFVIKPVLDHTIKTQEESDSIRDKILSLPFYKNLLYNDSTHATLMAIKLDQKTLKSKERVALINAVQQLSDSFSTDKKTPLYYTGLPYIRTVFAQKIQKELNLFLILSVLVTSIILYIFFRSFSNILYTLIIIGIIIIWTMGFVVMMGFKLTLLTGLIPPLIVIIAVPNFIYFLNRYHVEYRKYGNKYRGIIMMMDNIAKIVFLNNTTTAIGFGVLYFVDSPVLKEFGLVAFFMITATYFATIIIMPLIFTFMPEPSPKQIHYLNSRSMNGFINGINNLVQNKRRWVYTFTIILAVASFFGVMRLKAVGYIMDDIPKTDKLYTDLQFFEENFRGVMPFEITINTGRPNGAMDLNQMAKIKQLEDTITSMPEFGTAISIANVAQYANQAFYNGNPARYVLPSKRDLIFLVHYIPSINRQKTSQVAFAVTDSTKQVARITTKMADVGSVRLKQIINRLDKAIPKIWEGEKINYHFTGFSLIFLKGNSYLIENLASSLTMAILAIIIVIAILFPNVRLVLITLVPNLLALVITGALMGFLNIPLKPSSVLVFSIAFGIAVDASFHLLVNYRQDLKQFDWDVKRTVANALRETGYSIIYTSLVLFFGFGIFCFSSFGSTIALGALTSLTILCAMFTNIIIIPALLLSFDRKSRREARLQARKEQK